MDDLDGELVDVAVVGGGPAGLSGALVLARSRRRVVVVDGGEPRNGPAEGVHGFLTRDGTPPRELVAMGRADVDRYGGRVVDGRVADVEREGGRFDVRLADGRSFAARRLLVTTGLVDELPDVPGVRELWGGQVVHCPYCHGWEVRERRIGVLATTPMATHQALLFRQLADDVVLFAAAAPPSAEQRRDLAARGVAVVEGPVEALEVVDGVLRGVRMADGRLVERDVVAVQPRFVARSGLLAGLGVEVVEHGPGLGWRVAADVGGRAAPGVWVAGNVTDLAAQVVVAAGAGAVAAAAINADLVAEDVRLAPAAV